MTCTKWGTILTTLLPSGNLIIILNHCSKVREILLTHPELSLYINQSKGEGINSKTLIFENPRFQPFTFNENEIIGKIDEKRTRYQFETAFKDISKESEGTIKALIIVSDNEEAYFESLAITLDKPVEKTIRVAETEIEAK